MVLSRNPAAVQATCRRCGKKASSNDFVLDYVYKMAVCPSCVKERKNPVVQTVRNTPADWDEDDEELARGKTVVKARCKGCSHMFSYDKIKHSPSKCPRCSKAI